MSRTLVKTNFWGAVRDKYDNDKLVGINALGRLLMELRQKYMSDIRYDLLVVEPLRIGNFKLFGGQIQRINFVKSLIKGWGLSNYFSEQLKEIDKTPYTTKSDFNSKVNEPLLDAPSNGHKVEVEDKKDDE